ncbi:hypothetical protein CAPTEDRAFT_96689 [Capitella teleta]|uniref:Uncharacterized protein n=1 Tax=Capitella teleta TaxID=283909 RepID=R7UJE0_CAPTE|nr:hypothetical protein CAPTEDRAFT_96689 [Capitella teleta]|eukprot:ELU06669.1 hypothetical protein CAPTEDRAFT_96689 [Capitella teleta]
MSGGGVGGAYIGLQIDWSEVVFVDTTDWAHVADSDNHNESTHSGNVLFQTKFTNNTQEAQEYTMRTEKTTTSTASTEIETCLTKGIEIGVTLKSPCEVFEASAGYKREMSLTNVHGETFEEELNWGVESLIRVKARHEAEAALIVDEKKQNGDFIVHTEISGTVFVKFTNTRDKNEIIMQTGHTIADIVEEFLEKQRRKGHQMEFAEVFVKTKGRCNFRYGIRQEIRVDQKLIE